MASETSMHGQAKRHGVSPGNIAAQVGLMSVAQPPLEAAPTPQGYAQRQALGHGQGHNQGPGLNDGTGQVHGQGQSLMDQSRPRNETDVGADETGGSSDHPPMNLSLVRLDEIGVLLEGEVDDLLRRIFRKRLSQTCV